METRLTAPFISVPELAAFLHREIDPDDELAEMACDSGSEIVRDYCRQQFNFVEDDEVRLDGSGTDAIMLPELPIVDVTEVSVEGEALDTDQYILGDVNAGILYRLPVTSTWTEGRGNVMVTYSHGYSISGPGNVPSGVRIVAIYVAARIWDQGIVMNESVGGYSAGYSDALLTPAEKQILARHRHVHKR